MPTTKKNQSKTGSNDRSVIKSVRIPVDIDEQLNEELIEFQKTTMTNITYHQLLVSILRKHCEARKKAKAKK